MKCHSIVSCIERTFGNGIREVSMPFVWEFVVIETFSPVLPVCTGLDVRTVSLC